MLLACAASLFVAVAMYVFTCIHVQVAKKCGDKWHDFGVYLEIDMGELDDIREKHRDSLSDRLFEVLHSWSLREGRKATVGKLIDISGKVQVKGAVITAL